MSIIPASFLVCCRFPVRRDDRFPRNGKQFLGLPEHDRLLFPSQLDGMQAAIDLRVVWNSKGLGFELTVSGRSMVPISDPDHPTRADSLQIWLDTRNTQSIHRATRFCHSFCLLPVGWGDTGADAIAVHVLIARAAADPPTPDVDSVLIQSRVQKTGYSMEAWFSKEALHGFDPTHQPLLGFFCCLHDAEFGTIPLSYGSEFPFDSDPSLWQTLELQD